MEAFLSWTRMLAFIAAYAIGLASPFIYRIH